ncbi:hypothetical protein [Mycobacterium sp. AZCC_0083]|uniref:hypothetical protein n=1 Tax=Mycobacterium sp. AZCC_0083 TaxID=2735882 RepID=UPI00183F9BBF|nr:hypothetical protein [Mycobacterium sp. AZCC_0083]MBB5167349.1 hypothetical protein [Mycobacterium sp. AZCC_0083]
MSSSSDRHNDFPPYDVTGDWADLSAVPRAASCWVHNAVVATDDGELIGFHAGQLVAFDTEGRLLRVVETDLTEGHGISVVREGEDEYLWVCDPGFVFRCAADEGDPNWTPLFGKGVHCETRAPRVVKMTLDGQILSELPNPPQDPAIPAGPMGPYCPCGCVVDEERFGGTGDIWVADGYGSGLVHRFDKDGNHLSTLTGEEGSGRLLCPHAIFIDRRNDKVPELYIADRINVRVLVYDLEGRYLRTFGETFLNSPSDFAQWGDLLVVAEIYERLAVLDSDDSLVGYIGADPDPEAARGWPTRPGWPNDLADDGRATLPHLPQHDRFNSPHSVAADADGNLYVSEWLLGGRYTKLTARR